VNPSPLTSEVVEALGACTSTCRLWPEQMEGPYHRDQPPVRRDITENSPGLPLALGLALVNPTGGPLVGATVEIWQCDALGRYSGFPPPAPMTDYAADRMFLRGRQTADANGAVEFRTVYPGWYPGRTIHIHLRAEAAGRTFISQLYFPEATNDDVLARDPYRARVGRDTTNATDSIASTGGGPALLDVLGTADRLVATTRLLVPVDPQST
jgi:protocatechuate 3,4-dioxygenase beta subunit